MNTTAAERESSKAAHAPKLERLALLYEGILTATVRVQSGKQQLQGSENFRARMKQALKDIGDLAARRGYRKEDVEAATFAIVAFLDETVQSSAEGARTNWARKSLQEELFEQRSAGEFFFKKLEELRAHRDSPELAEVLEVFYLCLLLGYEGRYAAGSKAELHLLMDGLRERIERIFGRFGEFSPDAALPDKAPPPKPVDPLARQIRLGAAAALIIAVLFFVAFRWHLSSLASDIDASAQAHEVR